MVTEIPSKHKMLVFVDESGCTGLKLDSGSTPRFIIIAVRFDDLDEAQRCDNRISELRKQLNVSPEFHFTHTSTAKRKAFLTEIVAFKFSYTGIVFIKSRLHGAGFRYHAPFYKTAVNYAFQNMLDDLRDAKVVLDKSGDREFTRSMKSYLKKKTQFKDGSPRIGEVIAQNSISNNLLQLVDMVCGSVARSYGPPRKRDDCDYRKIIRCKETYVQEWPKKDPPPNPP